MLTALAALMRRFSIRTRMRGAIAMALCLFAIVGLVGVAGGLRLKYLNVEFMQHSMHETATLAAVRQELAQVLVLEKNMVIDYEDGVAVLKHRESWNRHLVAVRKALEGMGEGEDDADNTMAQAAVKQLQAYEQRSKSMLDNIQNGGYDSARVADRMRAKAKESFGLASAEVERIAAVVTEKVAQTQRHFDEAMFLIFAAYCASLAAVVVVPLTLTNSNSNSTRARSAMPRRWPRPSPRAT